MNVLPSKRGLIFLQQVMPPSLVYWPKAVSKVNKGIPHVNRKIRYGMRKAPANFTEEHNIFASYSKASRRWNKQYGSIEATFITLNKCLRYTHWPLY